MRKRQNQRIRIGAISFIAGAILTDVAWAYGKEDWMYLPLALMGLLIVISYIR